MLLSQAEPYWIEETTLYLWTIAEVLLDLSVPRARQIHNENFVSAHKVHSLKANVLARAVPINRILSYAKTVFPNCFKQHNYLFQARSDP